MSSVIMGMAGFLAANLGAFVIDLLEGLKLTPVLFQINPLQQLFLFGSLASLLLALTFRKMVKPIV